jgi:hypothetical protein
MHVAADYNAAFPTSVKLLPTYELPQEPSVVSDLGLPTCFESDQLSED